MKPPSFQFYPSDFLGGTAEMTATEVGCYMLLLCHEWITGSIPTENHMVLRICYGSDPGPRVMEKFTSDGNGRLINLRLELEREKQRKYRESRTLNGKQGGRPPTAKNHMVNSDKPYGLETSNHMVPSSSSSSNVLPVTGNRATGDRKPATPDWQELNGERETNLELLTDQELIQRWGIDAVVKLKSRIAADWFGNADDLHDPEFIIAWFRLQLRLASPMLPNSEAWCIIAIAVAIAVCRDKTITNPVGCWLKRLASKQFASGKIHAPKALEYLNEWKSKRRPQRG